jgi:hypothetical protein
MREKEETRTRGRWKRAWKGEGEEDQEGEEAVPQDGGIHGAVSHFWFYHNRQPVLLHEPQNIGGALDGCKSWNGEAFGGTNGFHHYFVSISKAEVREEKRRRRRRGRGRGRVSEDVPPPASAFCSPTSAFPSSSLQPVCFESHSSL